MRRWPATIGFLLVPALLLVLVLSSACTTPPPPRTAAPESSASRQTHEAFGKRFIISTQGTAATQAAERIFSQGGNIIDAAIAASFAISVERPQSSGLGGGGFLLYREAKTGRTYAVDFRERAPGKAARDMFLDGKVRQKGKVIHGLSTEGILAVSTPGLVAGLTEIQKRFGSLPLSEIVEPAFRLAQDGFAVYPHLAKALEEKKEVLARSPAARKIFLHPDGKPLRLGELLVQTDLAQSLKLIGEQGDRAFYWGPIAQAILQESGRLHGLLTQADLDGYRVKWREPVTGDFKGYRIFSMPPPSSGGVLVVEILNVLANDPLDQLGFHSASSVHLIAQALQQAFADRAEYLGDPDFVPVPTDRLVSQDYARGLRARFTPFRARPAADVRPGGLEPSHESGDTTHFSIMDSEGNVVSSTQTINGYFGSGVVVPGTGIVLNDEMDDFSAKPGSSNLFGAIGGDANAIAPGKTPLSSMSPTIVLKDGAPVLALGAPGGTRIISCVAETILNYLEYKLPLYDSVAAPRFHQQWKPDRLDIDAPGLGARTEHDLASRGYRIQESPDQVPCRVMAVAREGETLHGVSDPRDAGSSLGR